jgi:predicted HicB family RNase H-like nuclease
MGYLKYKGYTGSVEFSDEDNCLYGKVLGMSKDAITYEGKTVNALREDFEGAVNDYLASCKKRRIEPCKPYSGKLNLRMSSELHREVAVFAAKTGTTINDFINQAIRKALSKSSAL